jgi:hypothetical protein
MFNIYLGIYIIAALFIIGGGTYKLYGMEQTYGAFLFFVGVLYVFVVYGLRWFGSASSLFAQTPVSWPPTINTCPDFLTYYGRKMPDGTVKDTCIDFIGVSKNGTLKVFPKDGLSNPPASDNYYFSLTTTSTNAAGKNAALCQSAMTYGLTWEGITNGDSCVAPLPPTGGNAAGSSAACDAATATPPVTAAAVAAAASPSVPH